MATPTETGICKTCQAPFTSYRNRFAVRNSRVPAKLYCSEACSRRAYYLRRKDRGG